MYTLTRDGGTMKITIAGLILLALGCAVGGAAAAEPAPARLGTDIIGLFPKEVGQLAYADLKAARRHRWFPQLKEQMLPSRFRQFEQFLASAGIDPNTQVDELAWAATFPSGSTGEQIVGVALGQFQPASAEAYYESQKLATLRVRGYTLFAFGSGQGATDIFFFFIDSNTAAFGHRQLLEKLIEVRFGMAEGLLRHETMMPLINDANGRGVVWAVLDRSYTRLAFHQLVPEATKFPDAETLLARISAMIITIEADRGVDARFQAVCDSPEDTNTFAALLQAAVMYRRFQEAESNPEMAKMLDGTQVTPRGERLELRVAVNEEQMMELLRRNSFAVRM